MIDWKRKLTSRKFWLALIGFVTAILVFFNIDGNSIERVTALIMAGGSLIAFIVGEGYADGQHAKNDTAKEEEELYEEESEDEPKDGEETGFEDEEEET